MDDGSKLKIFIWFLEEIVILFVLFVMSYFVFNVKVFDKNVLCFIMCILLNVWEVELGNCVGGYLFILF